MKTTYLMAALLAGVFAAGGSCAQSTSCAEQLDADYGLNQANVSGAKSAAAIATEGVQCAASLKTAVAADQATITSLNATIATNKTALAAAQAAGTADQTTITGLNATIAQDQATISNLQAEMGSDQNELSSLSNTLSQDQMTIQNQNQLLCNLWQLDCYQAQAQASASPNCAGNLTCGFGVLVQQNMGPNGSLTPAATQYQNCVDMLNEDPGIASNCG